MTMMGWFIAVLTDGVGQLVSELLGANRDDENKGAFLKAPETDCE